MSMVYIVTIEYFSEGGGYNDVEAAYSNEEAANKHGAAVRSAYGIDGATCEVVIVPIEVTEGTFTGLGASDQCQAP